ncbi:hypothetical protein F0249_16920 [Vibrio sp. 03-59-1]|uniref:hypothetical protein n=1 Tax=Vibrio sp. 03-59-1 TaxID=2607607 RepID=UPI0014933E85|nr:hypothetical protein [Vibrio sp. 03-59-1]NOH85479.1 hypothetical protein [Vibrio sp. 03-59-1]
MKIKNILMITAWVLVSYQAKAAVSVASDNNNHITLNVSETYLLGDNDTLTQAKDINLEQVKKEASEYAGTYVESELKVSGSNIAKQEIRVLTAGYLEVLSVQNKRKVNGSGILTLTTQAKIRVSKESVRDGLAKFKSDPERKAKIKKLETDNNRLRNELLALTKKINTGTSRLDLVEAREKVLSDLNSNRQATKQVFEKGTLFQLAVLGGSDGDLAKKDIEENVFGYFQHEIKVTLGTPEFKKNNNGKYDIFVPVEWNLPKAPAEKVLNKYFNIETNVGGTPYTVGFEQYYNKGNKMKRPFSSDLQSDMRKKFITIKVNTGSHYGYLPISNVNGFGNKYYTMQFSNDSKRNRLVGYNFRNPVVIKDVSELELQSITSIESEVVVLNSSDLRRWKYE